MFASPDLVVVVVALALELELFRGGSFGSSLPLVVWMVFVAFAWGCGMGGGGHFFNAPRAEPVADSCSEGALLFALLLPRLYVADSVCVRDNFRWLGSMVCGSRWLCDRSGCCCCCCRVGSWGEVRTLLRRGCTKGAFMAVGFVWESGLVDLLAWRLRLFVDLTVKVGV